LKKNGYLQDTIFGLSKIGIQFASMSIAKQDNISTMLDGILAEQQFTAQDVKPLNSLIKHFNAEPKDLMLIEKLAQHLPTLTVASRKKVLYILTGLNGEEALELFVRFGLMSSDYHTQLDAILAANGISPENTNERILQTLQSLAFGFHSSADVNAAAILAYGAAVGRTLNQKEKERGGRLILGHLNTALSSKHVEELVKMTHSLGNAGPSILFSMIPWEQLLNHANISVKVAAIGALRKFKHQIDVPAKPSESNFPYNRSWTDSFTLGGSQVNAVFDGLLFAGTNFDCNHPYFNYEVEGLVNATLTFFEWQKEALDAEVLYGKVNGNQVGNEVYLRVWDDVIYNSQLPTVDCSEHTYPLYHTQQGVSISYTLWVTVIPVTFSASASLTLDLSWGWQICDSKLSAMVELIPQTTITLDADAQTFLLIVIAGIDITGSFEFDLRPQGYIDGSLCTVGFDVKLDTSPSNDIALESWYQWHSCKYWIFDCHWDTPNTQVWYSWSFPVTDEVVYNKDWKITP